MGKYDDERKALGLQPFYSSTKDNNDFGKYTNERNRIMGEVKTYEYDPIAEDQAKQSELGNMGIQQMGQTPMLGLKTSPVMQQTDQFTQSHPPLPGRDIPVIGPILKGLDFVADNPISNAVAEYTMPNAPFIGQSGTNVRQSFLNEAGRAPATGVSKFIGAAAAPFFVPGAQLGTGNDVAQLAKTGLTRYAPQLTKQVGENAIGLTKLGSATQGASVGGLTGFGSEYAQGNADTWDATKSGLAGTALGGALGGLAPVVAEGLQKFVGTKIGDSLTNLFGRKKTPQESQFDEILGLPAAGESYRSPEELARINLSNRAQGTVLPRGKNPIQVTGDIYKAPTLALPEGNPVPKTRLKISDNNQALDYVMKQIMPEVEQTIKAPKRRDLLVNYISQNHNIPVEEVWNMPTKDLQELGQLTEQGLRQNTAKIAFDTASKRGYDLPSLLDGKGQRVASKVATDAEKRMYGIYPDQRIGIRQPEGFNRSITGEVAAPIQKMQLQNKSVPVQLKSNQESKIVQSMPFERASVNSLKPVPSGKMERGFINTLRDSEKIPETLKERFTSAYKPLPNETVVAMANKRIDKDMVEATSYVLGKSRATAEKVTTAHRLIDEYTKLGNHEMAATVAEHIAEELTRAGQTVQAASIFNRLTPEGVLVHAQRIAQKTNESLSVFSKEAKVTPEMAAQLTDLATTTQKMTGVKDLANDVVSILDKAKSGNKLNDMETQTLRKFIEESKQFVKEVERKPRVMREPRIPREKRVRDNVISFLDAQEQAAKERLRARGIRISSTPLDIWADYAVIGAAKMAKGSIKFAEWSAEMLKDLGEEIRPHLENLYDRARETFEISTNKVSKQTISNAEKIVERVIKNKNLTSVEAKNLREMALQVSNLSGDAKRIASQDLQAIIQELNRPTVGKRISSVQTMAQLLNPKTLIARNALGNELFYRLERFNKLVATPIDMARVKLFGGNRSVTFRTHNQGQYWKNWLTGLRSGWRGVNVDGLQSQYDIGPSAFRGKWNPLTYMEKALGATLRSFDYAAYGRAVNNTIGEMATLRAINEGLTGTERASAIQRYIREADDNMIKIADEYGKYVTFQDNNVISKGLTKAKRLMNAGKDFGVGDLVLKYPKTPGALLMRALEYSPAGFLRSAYIAAKPILQNSAEANTSESMMALTRAITGTLGLSGLGYFLVDKGILTGSASKDQDIRELQKSAGQGQYQVNLSALKRWVLSGFNPDSAKMREGDQLYTYDWMQPVSMAVSMGANIKQSINEGLKKEGLLTGVAKTGYNSLEGGLNSLVEQSVLSGVKKAFQNSPGQTVMDKVSDILSDIPSSFVPSALNQAKQLMDNSKRETYSPNKLEQSLNKAKAKIPGLAGSLPQQYDTLGRPKETYQNNSAFNVLLNPGFSSNYELSPEARMIVNLINETGDESLAPRVPQKSIQVKDEKGQPVTRKLTGKEFSRIQQLQGEATRNMLSKISQSDSNKAKSDRVSKGLTKSGEDARAKLKKEIGAK